MYFLEHELLKGSLLHIFNNGVSERFACFAVKLSLFIFCKNTLGYLKE